MNLWKRIMGIKNKRAIGLGIALIVYLMWKTYVLYTPSPLDDEIPDKIRDAVLTVVYDGNDYYDVEFDPDETV